MNRALFVPVEKHIYSESLSQQ
uniref:Uncharacterized protein n=1 Tax=Anguilla anguilla TaxID=7936 RepID=A0A0E9PQS7_ANGAN